MSLGFMSRRLRILFVAGVLSLAAAGAGWVVYDLLTVSDAELRAMSTRELLLLVERERPNYDAQSPARRAAAEVVSRPRDAVIEDLRILLRDPEPAVRAGAASSFDWFVAVEDPLVLDPETAEVVHGLLDDPEESVRGAAVRVLCKRCHSQGLPAPDRAIAVLHELLQSKEPRLRLHAAWTLLCLGDAATDFLPDLLNLLDSDEDEGVRFMATCAFAIAGAGDPRTVPVLTALLSDKSEKVRLAAVGSLGQLGENASAAVPALHARFVDASEAEDVRRAALHALARTARGAQCAELVPEVLQASSSFTGYHEVEWTLATGRLAAEVPGTPAAKAAREALAPRAADMEGYDDVALAAVCGLAWIACAERDTALASPMKEVLVSTMEDLVRTPADVQIPLDETGQAAVEASINLVLWPEMKVDPAPIVGVLDRCAAPDVPRYLREWAAGQRARLP
jgi:HEAT repeat protein